MDEFNKKGFPIIKLRDDYFEIKAIDFWKFKTFKYSEILEIDYYQTNQKYWYLNILQVFSYSRFESYKLKIFKKNGAVWTYNTAKLHDNEFDDFIKKIKDRCNLTKSDPSNCN